LIKTGKVAAAKRRRAQVLLKADAGAEGSGPTDLCVLYVSKRGISASSMIESGKEFAGP
jgi:hypothetical protein